MTASMKASESSPIRSAQSGRQQHRPVSRQIAISRGPAKLKVGPSTIETSPRDYSKYHQNWPIDLSSTDDND